MAGKIPLIYHLYPLIAECRWYIISQLAICTTYIPIIYCQLGDYRLPTAKTREPETAIDLGRWRSDVRYVFPIGNEQGNEAHWMVWLQRYPPKNQHIPIHGMFEDDFPFPKVGYVTSPENSQGKKLFPSFWRNIGKPLWKLRKMTGWLRNSQPRPRYDIDPVTCLSFFLLCTITIRTATMTIQQQYVHLIINGCFLVPLTGGIGSI